MNAAHVDRDQFAVLSKLDCVQSYFAVLNWTCSVQTCRLISTNIIRRRNAVKKEKERNLPCQHKWVGHTVTYNLMVECRIKMELPRLAVLPSRNTASRTILVNSAVGIQSNNQREALHIAALTQNTASNSAVPSEWIVSHPAAMGKGIP